MVRCIAPKVKLTCKYRSQFPVFHSHLKVTILWRFSLFPSACIWPGLCYGLLHFVITFIIHILCTYPQFYQARFKIRWCGCKKNENTKKISTERDGNVKTLADSVEPIGVSQSSFWCYTSSYEKLTYLHQVHNATHWILVLVHCWSFELPNQSKGRKPRQFN